MPGREPASASIEEHGDHRMNIAIFGANGGTGMLLVQRSISAGHSVTVLTRTPLGSFVVAKEHRPHEPPFQERSLRIVRGSVFELTPVLETLQGADAVFSALGAHSPFRNENVLPRAVPVIVQAMQQTGVRRIIALGSSGALPSALDRQPALQRWGAHHILYPYLFKWPIYEQVEQHRLLADSGLDWTMPLPPFLTNGRERGRYRIDANALPRFGMYISRADVAAFMFHQLTSEEWIRRGVFLSY
jgi:uncharacterized protein